MHTVMMIGIGVIALAVFAVGGALSGRSAAWGVRAAGDCSLGHHPALWTLVAARSLGNGLGWASA
jgi:hypothetical protein